MKFSKTLLITALIILASSLMPVFIFSTLNINPLSKIADFTSFKMIGKNKGLNDSLLIPTEKGQSDSEILPAVKAQNFSNKASIKTDEQEDADISLTFAGDMMFGRLVGHRHQDNNFNNLFKKFNTDIFSKSDLAWANLEGPVSDIAIKQSLAPNNFNFLFSNETVAALKNLKLDVVGLANNHTYNAGQEGLTLTQELLTKNNIGWHGHPTKVNEDSVYRFEKNNVKVSLIAVHNLYHNADIGINETIKKESEKDNFVIVLPHWGEEYEIKHSSAQENLAKEWVESGADLIIGHHAHVVQDAQSIKNKNGNVVPVFYSLGNFVFDQTFSVETQLGLIVEVKINKDGIKGLKLFPIESVDLFPQLADIEKSEIIIKRVCDSSGDLCLMLDK